MKQEDVKHGMKVRCRGQSILCKDDVNGKTGFVYDPVYRVWNGDLCVRVVIDGSGNHNLIAYENISPLEKSGVARIQTEKLMVKSVPCRKILAFEGILSRDKLPAKYVCGAPSFWLVSAEDACINYRIFDGKRVALGDLVTTDAIKFMIPAGAEPIPDMGDYSYYLNIGDVVTEAAYLAILVWLKRAGSQLAKIRKEEKMPTWDEI